MFLFHLGEKSINMGMIENRKCPVCESTRPFAAVLSYRFLSLYWIFSMVTGKKYLLLCEICHRGIQIGEKEWEAKLLMKGIRPAPIPFMRRYGLLVFAAIAAAIAGLAFSTGR